MLSESKYLVDFLVGFLDKKPQTLLIPIYSITVPYDTRIQLQLDWEVDGKVSTLCKTSINVVHDFFCHCKTVDSY